MENEQTNKHFCALEISSRAVRLVYGFVYEGLVRVLHAVETNVDALKDGYVETSDALTMAIKNVISSTNDALKIKIKEVVLAVPPMGLCFARESTTCTTIDINNRIVQHDINNCLSQLRKIKFNETTRVVDVIPYKYVLNNNETLYEPPLGKISSQLTVHASIYGLENKLVDGYIKACTDASLNVRQVVISPLAASMYLPRNERIPSAYYLLNIGAKISILTLINRGLIVQNACFNFGGDKITQSLSDKLRLSFKDAKMLKEKYGMDIEPSFKCPVFEKYSIRDISSVIQEAIDPLISSIGNKINAWSSIDHTINPIILTGGGSKLYGLKSLIEQKVQGIQVLDFSPYSFGARDKSFQNCLGMISYADKYLSKKDEDSYIKTSVSRVGNEKAKNSKGNTTSYRIEEEL